MNRINKLDGIVVFIIQTFGVIQLTLVTKRGYFLLYTILI